ncbi:hypothetical protein RIF29_19682 [Crotalaria pallida]|uniref:Uncharacterized protein n=1 Tax=Crotalaria pallida TaxID=3830 RepID=A0AAN9F885_CROPI
MNRRTDTRRFIESTDENGVVASVEGDVRLYGNQWDMVILWKIWKMDMGNSEGDVSAFPEAEDGYTSPKEV